MLLTRLLHFALTFYALSVSLGAALCPKGQMVKRETNVCVYCRTGRFQSEENYRGTSCSPCTKCNQESGSAVKRPCTREMDTQCECRPGFIRWDDDSSDCKCDIGFGLKDDECSECEDGYFSNAINTACRQWKVCRSGVSVPGTRTSDVICNESQSKRPHEQNKEAIAITTSSSSSSTTTTTTTPTVANMAPKGITKNWKPELSQAPNSGKHIGVVLFIAGFIGLLLLTAVTCKLRNTPPEQRPIENKESLYGRPVEESGDGTECSVKLNLGEP